MADEFDKIGASFAHISKEDIEECKKQFDQGGTNACKGFLLKKAEEWKTIPLNIGVIGSSGTGKSSFINAIRGLTGEDIGAAKVGVTETTLKPMAYPHPSNEQLKFWDLPGVGTPDSPREGYLERIGFSNFDFFLILSCDRFTENDLWIAVAIEEKKKRFFFLRTKIHNNVRDDKFDHPISHKKENVLAEIQNNISKNLGKLYKENIVFLIDNHKRTLYDFERLEERLVEDFPSLKRQAYILSMSALSEGMVKRKVKELRRLIWACSALSGCLATIPLPGLSVVADVAIIKGQHDFYLHQLGLDDKSLRRTARIMNCDVNSLQQIVDENLRTSTTASTIGDIVKASMAGISMVVEEQVRLFPILGSLVAGALSFGTTCFILNGFLTEMEKVAIMVLKAAAVASSANLVDECDGVADDDKN